MNITPDSYVAEWRHSQQEYHIQSIRQMLECNNQQHLNNEGPDYIPLGFFATGEEASAFIDACEKQQEIRASQDEDPLGIIEELGKPPRPM